MPRMIDDSHLPLPELGWVATLAMTLHSAPHTNSNPCQPPGPGSRPGESNVTVTHAPSLSCSIHPASKYTKYGNIVTDCDGVRLDCVMANIGGQ